jgi:hypothetical protein
MLQTIDVIQTLTHGTDAWVASASAESGDADGDREGGTAQQMERR